MSSLSHRPVVARGNTGRKGLAVALLLPAMASFIVGCTSEASAPRQPTDVGACDAGALEVESEIGPYVFVACAKPFDHRLFPAPVEWFDKSERLDLVLAGVVNGADEASSRGLWSGFDLIDPDERDTLTVDTEVSETGVTTIAVLDSSGSDWQPPASIYADRGNVRLFVDVLAATALSFAEVTAVQVSICPEATQGRECPFFQQSVINDRVPTDFADDCTLVEYWTNPRCVPSG